MRILLDCGGRVETASGHVRGVATPQQLFGLRKDREDINISSIDVILISSYRLACDGVAGFLGLMICK